MECWDENLFKCSESHDQDGFQAHIWYTFKISFLGTKRLMTLNLVYNIGYSSTTKFVQIMTLG